MNDLIITRFKQYILTYTHNDNTQFFDRIYTCMSFNNFLVNATLGNINNLSLSELIYTLRNIDYNFEDAELDKLFFFLISPITKSPKSICYINDANMDNWNETIIEIIFSEMKFNDKKVNDIIKVLKRQKKSRKNFIISLLIENRVQFNELQVINIVKLNICEDIRPPYNYPKLFFDNYVTLDIAKNNYRSIIYLASIDIESLKYFLNRLDKIDIDFDVKKLKHNIQHYGLYDVIIQKLDDLYFTPENILLLFVGIFNGCPSEIFKIMINKHINAYGKNNLNNLTELCKHISLESLLFLIDQDVNVNLECIHTFMNKPIINTKITLSKIFKKIVPVIKTFELLFKFYANNKLLINKMMDTHKFYPNINCLNNLMLCHSKTIDDIKNLLDCKITPNDTTLDNLLFANGWFKTDIEIIELLISYGYIITYDSLEKILSNNRYVDKLERFGIPCDEKLYYICYKSQIALLQYYKFDINQNLLSLRQMIFDNVDVNKIIKFIENNNIKPDRYCADNILDKPPLCQYFLKNNYTPSPIFGISLIRNYKGLFEQIMQNVDFDYTIMSKQYV